MVETPKQRRGFAAMPIERRREIATTGGRAAQAKGTAHRWNAETAVTAGKRGAAARNRPKDSSKKDL
jgi:general stress protein YciG